MVVPRSGRPPAAGPAAEVASEGCSARTAAALGPPLAVAALVVLAGCLAAPTPAGTDTPGTDVPAPDTPVETAEPPVKEPGDDVPATPSVTPYAVPERACVDGVSFWGLGDGVENRWAADRVRVGFSLPARAAVLLVVEGNGTVLATAYRRGGAKAVAVDGAAVTLDRPLDGTHAVRVVAYADVDRNRRFDPSVDEQCRHDGEVVDDGPVTVDFGALDGGDRDRVVAVRARVPAVLHPVTRSVPGLESPHGSLDGIGSSPRSGRDAGPGSGRAPDAVQASTSSSPTPGASSTSTSSASTSSRSPRRTSPPSSST